MKLRPEPTVQCPEERPDDDLLVLVELGTRISSHCGTLVDLERVSGEWQPCRVEDNTTVLAFKKQLEEQRNLPEFYEITLYVAEKEISGLAVAETISSVGLVEGSELQAVAGVSISAACSAVEAALKNVRVRCTSAMAVVAGSMALR